MNEHRIQFLIQKFWEGTASKQECVELLQLLDELQRQQTDGSTEALMPLPGTESQEDLLDPVRREVLFNSIVSKINRPEKTKRRWLHTTVYRKVAICAALIVMAFVAKIIIEKLNQGTSNMVIQNKVASALVFDTIQNNGPQPKSILLADQSTVLLYPNSQICFDEGFTDRRVILKGKALFKVKHDAERIFTVTTGEFITTDIGTEFEIDAGHVDGITIRLLEGKVKVGTGPESTLKMADQYLDKREQLKIHMAGGKVVLEKTRLFSTGDKKTKAAPLVFNKTPLKTVFSKIAARYGVSVTFKVEDMAKLTFTGNVEPSDTLDDILNIICAINNLSYSKNSDGFTISQP